MSIYTTDLIIPPEFNHRKLERPVSQDKTIDRYKNRSRTYVIDFARIKKEIGIDKDLFYFYPQELEGFIVSSILSTQREHEDIRVIGHSMYDDLTSALHEFHRKEEEASWHSGVTLQHLPLTSIAGGTIDDYEINQAGRAGEAVMEFVLKQMKTIREIHGDYALSAKDMTWTSLGALIMKVYY